MAWHLAPALITFRGQLDTAFPHRDKRSDGTIGDARHRAEGGGSDHNPDASGSVNAFDITHGPFWHAPTVDGGALAQQLVASGDSRVKYVIFERRIWTPGVGWHAYSGVSPHLEHVHLSVTEAGKDIAAPWHLPMLGTQPTPGPPAPNYRRLAAGQWLPWFQLLAVPMGGNTPPGPPVLLVQKVLNLVVGSTLTLNSTYDAPTGAAVWKFQQNMNALKPGAITDAFPGVISNQTKFFIDCALANIANGVTP